MMTTDGKIVVRCKVSGVWEILSEGTWNGGALRIYNVPTPMQREIEADLKAGKEYGDWTDPCSGEHHDWECTD